ncbi:mitochondrial PGP phosphatase-domain-containing protein [Crucibulum laeve]|uniref:Mitochondrial PGP phosphatase-domain-containing protein n=1 Tax=Crucibulum laeve TaxID=68775 RepID=A0A5C3MM00_9AGAR|nr:mitochondrial PGP phosphatase-domain-containing protein [Crucibulum laeve]
MPINIPGLLAPFQLLIHPRLVLPGLSVKDIRQIDFAALKRAGYRGAVFDKDNCLTIPYEDKLIPELQEAWDECRETFGKGNVLIVSNSAGTYLDAGGIQSESVTHHLQVPVLLHTSFKPAYSCISAIRTYFSSLHKPIRDDELIIVGDRIFTDVILANRIRLQHRKERTGFLGSVFSCAYEKEGTVSTEKESLLKAEGASKVIRLDRAGGPLAIWTTGVWKREAMAMRWMEKGIVNAVEKWSKPPGGEPLDTSRFVKRVLKEEPVKKPNVVEVLLARLRKG